MVALGGVDSINGLHSFSPTPEGSRLAVLPVLPAMRWPPHRLLGPAEDQRLMLRTVFCLESLADSPPVGLGGCVSFGLFLLRLLRLSIAVLFAVCHHITLQAFRIISR
jgi:hypothetical protein